MLEDAADRATDDRGVSEETQKKASKEVLGLDKTLTEVDSELFQASEELRRFTAEKAKLEEPSFSDTSRVRLDLRTVSGTQLPEGEAGLAVVT